MLVESGEECAGLVGWSGREVAVGVLGVVCGAEEVGRSGLFSVVGISPAI